MLICHAYKCLTANNSIVGILTFKGMINFMLSCVEHDFFYNLGARTPYCTIRMISYFPLKLNVVPITDA